MADYRPTGITRNRLVAVLLTLSVAVAAVAAVALVKLDLFAEPTQAAPALPIVVSSTLLDFGAVPLNGAVIRHLVVRNDGADPLHATLTVDGKQYSVSPANLILHPGISSRIQIAVKADELGDLRDRLRINIEEAAESAPLVIALRGEATSGDPNAVTPAAGQPVAARPQLRAGAGDASIQPVNALPDGVPSNIAGTVIGATTTGLIADASAGVQPGGTSASRAGRSGASSSNPPSTTARRRTNNSNRNSDSASSNDDVRQVNGSQVSPYVAGVSVPIRSMAEVPMPVEPTITDSARERARALPERTTDGAELPDRLPEDEEVDDFERDIFDDESEEPEPDPFTRPKLTISGSSQIQLMGSNATFYPQEIGLIGAEVGGPFSLTDELRMPMVYLAFGESVLFRQTGPVSGEWDPMSGQVNLQVPIDAVDTDGDAAPWNLTLTTGTVYARNPSGLVLSKTGTPRSPDSGIVRLVGIFEIPVGFGNGAETQLAVFELLGDLSFGSAPREGFDQRF